MTSTKMQLNYVLMLISFLINYSNGFKLTILHNNDFHSRFAPITNSGAPCNATKRSCIGGVARTVHLVEKIKSDHDNVIFLNAGDFYQGSLWYTFYKEKIISKFVPLMGYDVMSLGNHEFDDGVPGLAPFVDEALLHNLPIVAANLDISNEPRLANLKKSVVIERNNRKIGIIGYVTPDTAFLATPGDTVKFEDEIAAIKREVSILESEGVNIMIALGHSGYARDKEIAAAIPQLDLVVGGHTNTFLWNDTDGPPPSEEKPLGSYPTVINHTGRQMTLVVQAHAYGKYLGKLDVEFDAAGNIIIFKGNPIYINSNISEVTTGNLKKIVDEYSLELSGKMSQVIGSTDVKLVGGAVPCRTGECSMGNFITDSYVFGFMQISKSQGYTKGWTKYPIAITSSGDIRNSIPDMGKITLADLFNVIPFGNTIETVNVTGKILREIFEHSVSTFDPKQERLEGRFLQVSGVRVTYDLTQPSGSRVSVLKSRCGPDCLTPKYENVVDNRYYSLISTNYLLDGGDGYSMVTHQEVKRENFEQLDFDLVQNYLKYKSPITTGVEERITFTTEDDSGNNSLVIQPSLMVTITPTIILCLIQLIMSQKYI